MTEAIETAESEDSIGLCPVFIGGFRSGTTLLVNLLGLHPFLTPWFETKALCEALRFLRVLRLPESAHVESALVRPAFIKGFSIDAVAQRMLYDFRETAARQSGTQASGKAPGERYPLGHDVVNYSLNYAMAAVETWRKEINSSFDEVTAIKATGRLIRDLGLKHKTLDGKPILVNKTPEIVRFMPELRLCLGSCSFIMMIRDGRDVVRSAARLGWAESAEIAIWWKAMIEEARHGAGADPSRYLEVRYEDLVGQTSEQLDSILRFLGVLPLGEFIVTRYRQILNIDALVEASSICTYPRRTMDAIDHEIESLIDAKFNAGLGY